MTFSSPSTVTPPAPLAGGSLEAWQLDPDYTFLNHGSFGARLRSVFDAQVAWKRRFESRPIEVLDRRRDDEQAHVRARVAAFLGMAPDDVALVTNATDGVNAVLRSLELGSGDEIVTTDHVYGAVRQTMRYLARRTGARFIEVPIPVPVDDSSKMADRVLGAITPRTRILVVDHVTSPTALRFPVERIVRAANAAGVDVLVDGAHAPGMLDLDVESIGAAWYTGNLHKWVCAPPGAAFLWARSDRQDDLHPTVISHFLDEGFPDEFRWQATRDTSAWLSVPDAIDGMDMLDGPVSWPRIRAHNHALAVSAHPLLADAWDVPPLSPLDGSWLGSMVALPVPGPARARFDEPAAMMAAIDHDHAIEVPIFPWNEQWFIRVSAQVYNRPEQYERLAHAVVAMG